MNLVSLFLISFVIFESSQTDLNQDFLQSFFENENKINLLFTDDRTNDFGVAIKFRLFRFKSNASGSPFVSSSQNLDLLKHYTYAKPCKSRCNFKPEGNYDPGEELICFYRVFLKPCLL